MSKIRINQFGPIKDGLLDSDWIEIKKVTIFIGNQGSGKSTIAKLISTFTWIEKALVRGDYEKEWFEKEGRFREEYLNYHRLENYFKSDSLIEYQGDVYTITYKNDSLTINESRGTYPLPQIMYIPAERNFISYVKSPKELRLTSESLQGFLTEFDHAKSDMKELLKLPINNVDLEYIDSTDSLMIKGDDYNLNILEASSGFQSLVPLFLVSRYLAKRVEAQSRNKETMSNEERTRFKKNVADIMNNNDLTDIQKREAISAIASKFNKTAFINIVEEPEQNLFPSSQWEMLQSLLEFNNMNEGNKLIMTTHSPYIINYLTLAVKAHELKNKNCNDDIISQIEKIVSLKAAVNPTDLAIYELDETNGAAQKLGNYKGLPSDENYLNNRLEESNDSFVKLLNLEDLCR
ncbi:ATP-binding protein [Bacteroides sp. 214]|uniref:AAA family ATPase n=1 Tax=Bacteroides sp. 214 TaxID=2302935 RepID=UPI0013D628AF|nr:AAA family ATPase [Bacteroides sp. 214]NDW13202.1 ATP-binding protein [Bacteroides sp. 214]